ncbi:unnamed protein product [Oppiella nova]|uniref:Protein FAM177A1 n=1 Tax=Oppiella nova TaxID=334625 RepID=A0A7R9QIE0_9ACAR|nr:unnamed protein product [Oppiella nova]CAG2166457.1 unnamed protein product [Oppiella nova]
MDDTNCQTIAMSVTTDCVKCEITPPKRVVHFSDGVVEEYESSEEEDTTSTAKTSQTDSNQQLISSWPTISSVKRSVLWFGTQSLKVCDYLGENLAHFLGITSPKYESEIDEYMRRMAEQEMHRKRQLQEFSGWSPSDATKTDINCVDTKDIPRSSLDLEKQRY